MNTEMMKRFDELEPEMLEKIDGGAWYVPLLPSYTDILSSICGFVDGFNGKKNKGSC